VRLRPRDPPADGVRHNAAQIASHKRSPIRPQLNPSVVGDERMPAPPALSTQMQDYRAHPPRTRTATLSPPLAYPWLDHGAETADWVPSKADLFAASKRPR
jgi:hypothetical protein